MDKLGKHDVPVVTKLDRLGHNAIDVTATVDRLEMGARAHCLAPDSMWRAQATVAPDRHRCLVSTKVTSLLSNS